MQRPLTVESEVKVSHQKPQKHTKYLRQSWFEENFVNS